MDGSPKLIWLNLGLAQKFMPHCWHMDFVGREQVFPGVNFWIDRSGAINNHHRFHIDSRCFMPVSNNEISWTVATILRVRFLEQLLEQRPSHRIRVLWSGGIDSTMILAALIKWLSPRYQNRVTVCLSAASIWENPYFYREHIQPRWNTEDSQYGDKQSQSIYISGSVNDRICYNELCLAWHQRHGKFSEISSCLDSFLDFLTDILGDKKQAKSVWQLISQTSQFRDIEIHDVKSALWWLGFNFAWQGQIFEDWRYADSQLELSDLINQNMLIWYNSVEYQQWAMSQYRNVWNNHNDFFVDYKKEQKEIIYSVDSNDFYKSFKQKTASGTKLFDKNIMPTTRLLAVDVNGVKFYCDECNVPQCLERLELI